MEKSRIDIKKSEELFLSGHKNLSVQRFGVLTCPRPMLGARFEVNNDISPLFPFVNGTIDNAKYYGSPERIQFIYKEIQCTAYATEIIAAAFHDYDQALAFCEDLVSFLNGIYKNRKTIQPDYRRIKPVSALDIYKILPKTNCQECGFPSCLAFAGALSIGKANTSSCPGIADPIEQKAVYPVLDQQGNLTSTIEISQPSSPEAAGNTVRADFVIEKQLLTERELQVLKLLAEGATNPQISKKLSVSPHTVKTHVTHIFDKIGVNDRTQAAVWALRHNII